MQPVPHIQLQFRGIVLLSADSAGPRHAAHSKSRTEFFNPSAGTPNPAYPAGEPLLLPCTLMLSTSQMREADAAYARGITRSLHAA